MEAIPLRQKAALGRFLLVEKLLCGNGWGHDRKHGPEVPPIGARLMRKTFKYRIYPTKATEQQLSWTLTRCRELYNAALSERKDAYTYAGKSISYYEQQNDL